MSKSAPIPNRLADQIQWLRDLSTQKTRSRPLIIRDNDVEFIQRLSRRRITTIHQLMSRLRRLPPDIKHFAIHWIATVRPHRGEEFLLDCFQKLPSVRFTCAFELGWMDSEIALQEFLRIARKQLDSRRPNLRMLEAIVAGFNMTNHRDAEEMLVQIYGRTDLPGWLRGDAGDALGCTNACWNRRSTLYRRVQSIALEGIHSGDLDVEFWSMYVIMQLASVDSGPVEGKNDVLRPALPRLREIAKTDHRLAPGYWWPMSEEAKDAIHCIRTGAPRKKDAADRWLGNTKRGVCNRQY